MNTVNKIYILSILFFSLISCKKNNENDQNVSYSVSVKVENGVEFFVHSTYMGTAQEFKIGTKSFNASGSATVQIPKGKTAYIKAQKTTSADANLEMIVTKAANGEIIYQGTGKNVVSIDVAAK